MQRLASHSAVVATSASQADTNATNLETPPVPNPGLVCDVGELLLREEETARRVRATGRKPGPITNLPTLDEQLGGFLAPGLHVLLAAPGAGKSALALQIAALCGCPALYVSAEMRRAELLRRLVARATSMYLGRLRGGEMTRDELSRLVARAGEACPMLSLYDVCEQPATVTALRERAEDLREHFASPYLLVVVDSITDWVHCSASPSARLEMGEYALAENALTGLKTLATALSPPILGIAHRSRSGQSKDADRIHAAKGTGRYEYIAESVWDLERDPKIGADHSGHTRASLTVLKNRQGPTGLSISLSFEGRLQKLSES